ncbi:MAG: DUF177 domain-containing protein [Vicingaceae bacterium]
MKKKKQRLIIPFSGLKLGTHRFEFEIDPTFFEQFEYSIIQDAEVNVEVDFVKKATLFEIELAIDGIYHSACDRCNDPLDIILKGKEELIVKFGDGTYDETDEIKIIPHEAYELDLTNEIYQFIHLMLPNKVAHEDIDDCNPDVIQKLEEINQGKEDKEENIDPRWAALKKLK